jgi:hypothetical protein
LDAAAVVAEEAVERKEARRVKPWLSKLDVPEWQELAGDRLGWRKMSKSIKIHRGASGARAFSLASCAAGDFWGLLASVPRLRDHTPAPQGRRRQAPQDRRRLTFFVGGS